MNDTGGPVATPPTQHPAHAPEVDFGDTQIAFRSKSDASLRHSHRLFRFMNSPRLVALGSKLGAFAVRHNLPFAESVTLATIYRQFVGGRTLLEVETVARELARHKVLSVLDYGAEGKNDEQAYNRTMTECIRALEFAARHASVPVVTTKVTGLTSDDLLVDVSAGRALDAKADAAYAALLKRLDSLCHVARQNSVQLYIDAEESWMQPAIDRVVLTCMQRYNTERPIVVNTYQMYRHDRLATLRQHHAACRSNGVMLGAKLVRGAYMDKENERARERGYPTPIQPSKEATDRDYDAAVRYCLEHIDTIGFVNASHNQRSSRLMLEAMHELGIAPSHPHAMFCQLYGMSDNLTFNLAAAGYRVGKYVPYGPVRDVVPYLVRRAQENTSITGEASRELALISQEIRRRELARGAH